METFSTAETPAPTRPPLLSMMMARGLRQHDVAVMLGVRDPTVHGWIWQRQNITTPYLGPLAAILGVPLEQVYAVAVVPSAVVTIKKG